jgi:hypothetical protein
MTLPPVFQRPKKIRVLQHPRLPALRVVQYDNGSFVLWTADGSRRSAPYVGNLRSFTARGWRDESAAPGRQGSLFELSRQLLDAAEEELHLSAGGTR